MTAKTISLVLMLTLTAAIWLAGCSKNSSAAPPSIVGSWAVTSIQEEAFSNGVVTTDDSIPYPPGQWVTTYQTNGYFVTLNSVGLTGGGYTLTGNALITVDTPHMLQFTYQVLTLTEHSLVIQAKDTTSLIPFKTGVVTETFSR